MNNKDFDKLLRDKFNNSSLQQQNDGWQQVEALLPNTNNKRRKFVYWQMAAAIALLCGIGIAFSYLKLKTPNNNIASVKSKNAQTVLNHRPSNAVVKSNKILQSTISTTPSSTPSILTNKGLSNKGIAKSNNMIFIEKASLQKTHLVKQDKLNKKNIDSQQFLAKQQNRSYHKSFTQDRPEPLNAFLNTSATQNTRPETFIALGGGMNYGALNTGYNIALSAKHSLNKHVFIEGSVSFLYNGQAEKSSIYSNQNTMPTRPAPGQLNNSRTSSPAASNFYYLEVNPSVGYQINQILSLSAGPDIQQRIATLGQDGTAIYTPGQDPRIIPHLDLGFTGKANFLINPKIETSILFRNGLNNLLKSPDVHPYLNRRYIQVQLKYNFLLGR